MNLHRCASYARTLCKEGSIWTLYSKALAPVALGVAWLCWVLGLITPPGGWEARIAGVCAYLEAYAGLTLADLCEVLGLHPGTLVLVPLASGLVRIVRRCKVPSGTGQKGWLQRVVGRSLSIVRAWQASAAADYVLGQLLLLAVHILHIILGAIQCGRYYAGDIARYALPWLLPAAWLQPGSFPLMLYTAFYTVIFVRLAVHVEPRSSNGLRSFFVIGEDRRLVPILCYPLFWWGPFSLLSSLVRLVVETPWPGWKYAPLLPWSFVANMEGPGILHFMTVLLAYPAWWRAALRKIWYCRLEPDCDIEPLVEDLKGGVYSSQLAFILAGPGRCAQTGRCQVEAWALAVIRLIYEEAKGPFALLGYILRSYPGVVFPFVVHSLLGAVITIPSQVLALAWRPASVVILRMRHSWSSVRLYATAGARWLEPPAVTALATMHMVLSQATGMGRAYLAPLVVAYTERRRKRQQHQQQRQRRRRTCKAPQLDDGLLSPRSGRASGRATPAREASSHPARFMEASKKMQDSKVAWQRSTSKHAQQLEDLPSPAAAAAPTISTAAMPETPASREVGRTRASNAALPSANQAAAPASVKGQKRYSRHSVDPAHDHRSSSGGSSAHGSPPAGHLPSIASSAVSITHPAGVLPVAATFTASKPPGEHPIVVQGQSKQWQQPRQRQLPSQLEGAGTPEQVVRQRKRQASVDSEAEGSRSTQAAPEPAAASAGVASSVGTPADLPDPMSFPQLNSGLKQIGKNINREAPVDRAAASSRTTQTAPKPRSASASPGVASLAGAPVHLSHPKASEVDSAWTPFTSLSPAWVPTPDQKPQAPSANIQPAGSSEGDECVYCTERPPAALCIPCGHLAFCEPCAQLLYRRGRTACELCRVELEGWWGPTMGQLVVAPAAASAAARGPSTV